MKIENAKDGQSFFTDDGLWIVSWGLIVDGNYGVFCRQLDRVPKFPTKEEAITEATRRYLVYRMTK